jgi:hypothetical protein
MILPDVLYGCETWSLTLREERRLRMRRTGEDYITKSFMPYTPPVNESRRLRWAEYVESMKKSSGAYRA